MILPATHRAALVVALALAMPLAWQAPLHASETEATAPKVDPHRDLYAAMDETINSDRAIDKMIQLITGDMRQDPQMAKFDRESPGLIRDIGRAMRPWFKKYSDRVEARHRSQYMQLLREAYTPEDAVKLAAYYRTKPGSSSLLDAVMAMDGETPALAPSQRSSAARPKPRQPLGQPNAFLRPAEGHKAAAASPSGGTLSAAPQSAARKSLAFLRPATGHLAGGAAASGAKPQAAPAEPHPAVAAYLADKELQAKERVYWRSYEVLSVRISMLDLDQDLDKGMWAAVDYAASTHGVRFFERPL